MKSMAVFAHSQAGLAAVLWVLFAFLLFFFVVGLVLINWITYKLFAHKGYNILVSVLYLAVIFRFFTRLNG